MHSEVTYMTLNDFRNMTNSELIKFVNDCKGHTGNNPDKPDMYFQTYANADFSYSSVITELQRRGTKNGWYFESEEKEIEQKISKPDIPTATEYIKIAVSDEAEVKKTYRIKQSVLERWDKNFAAFPSKSFLIGLAMNELNEKYENGNIKFVY